MADLILIPVVALLLCKISYNKTGLNRDYLSIETTQAMRGVMILDVVLFHFCLDYLNVNQKLLSVCQGDDAVKIFFFLSGYGLVYSVKHKGNAYLKGFFSHRLVKIAIPLVIAAIPHIFLFKHAGVYYLANTPLTLKTMFELFFHNGYTIVYNAWYVVELIVLYVAFYISFKIAKGDFERGVNITVLLTVLCMIGFYMLYLKQSWLHMWYFSTWAFAFGVIWSAKEEQIFKFIQKHFNLIFCVSILMVSFLAIFRREIMFQFSSDNYIMSKSMILGPFIVFGIIVGSMKFKLGCPVWKFLGKISYELFLIHGIFYNELRSGDIYIKNDLLYIVIGVALSIAAATLLYYIDRFILKGYFKLIGKKTKEESKQNG